MKALTIMDESSYYYPLSWEYYLQNLSLQISKMENDDTWLSNVKYRNDLHVSWLL